MIGCLFRKKNINEQLGSSAQATKGKDPAAQNITKKRGHPILTSQRGEGDRNETCNPVRISTPGQWRLPSGRDEDAGRRGKGGREDAHLDLDRGEAGRRGREGRWGGTARWDGAERTRRPLELERARGVSVIPSRPRRTVRILATVEEGAETVRQNL